MCSSDLFLPHHPIGFRQSIRCIAITNELFRIHQWKRFRRRQYTFTLQEHHESTGKHPSFPYPSVLRGKLKESSVLEWSGLSLKNLKTLGERSATGMDSERGVYVISVRVMSNPLRDYIYANDVILGFNRQEINNLTQLKAAIRQADTNKPVQILIFRNQKKMQLTIPGNIIKPTTD